MGPLFCGLFRLSWRHAVLWVVQQPNSEQPQHARAISQTVFTKKFYAAPPKLYKLKHKPTTIAFPDIRAQAKQVTKPWSHFRFPIPELTAGKPTPPPLWEDAYLDMVFESWVFHFTVCSRFRWLSVNLWKNYFLLIKIKKLLPRSSPRICQVIKKWAMSKHVVCLTFYLSSLKIIEGVSKYWKTCNCTSTNTREQLWTEHDISSWVLNMAIIPRVIYVLMGCSLFESICFSLYIY